MKPLNCHIFCFFIFLKILNIAISQPVSNNTIPYHVGVILNSSSSMGQMANTCISMGVSDFYTKFSNYKTRLVLHHKDSKGEPLQALSQAIDLLQNYQVQAIIGPQTSNEAEFMVNLGDKAKSPIISFSVTSPFVSHDKTPYFVRVANDDNFQVKAIAALIQAFRWREVVIMYEDDSSYGYRVIPNMISALDEVQVRVPYRSVISTLATDNEIIIELYKLMTMSTRVFVVHMSPTLAYRIFSKLNDLGMMSKGYAWIVTDGLTNTLSSKNSSFIGSLQGVLGLRPYLPHSKKLNDFFRRWKNTFLERNHSMEINDLNRYCLWAYDAIWALATSAEKLGIKDSENNSTKSSTSMANLLSIPESKTGPKLLELMLGIKLGGVSGPIELKNGELISWSPYEIINIVGKSIRVIGYLTHDGLTPKLGSFNNKTNLDSFTKLSPIWPGGSVQIPRGWVLPVSGKKLKIGVPVRIGFNELVKVERDPQTKGYRITGLCIDVFRAAVELLPYALPFEFIPFVNTNGTAAGDYNDLIYQVYLQKFDVAVGDVTITANRSLYVDFTLPFTEGGIAMVLPASAFTDLSMWVFLYPLRIDLWLVLLAFFISTGIIVWAIELRAHNDKLKGPALHLIADIFSKSLSNLVFAPGENLVRNFSKFVVIVWLFSSVIIISSYTASLSSYLTTRQLKHQFPKDGLIGYRAPSLVIKLLDNLSFKDTRMKPYNSDKEFVDALKKGNKQDGVSAIMDEIPYIRLFQANNPGRYEMINATYVTSGFAFVLQKRSPLLADLSGAIAKLRESGRLKLIEQAWYQHRKSFGDDEESKSDKNPLTSYNFRGLFLIMSITLVSAFVLSYLFSKEVPKNEVAEDDGAINTDNVEDHVLPFTNSTLSFVIWDHSSDASSSVKGDGGSVDSSPGHDHVNDTNHP